MTNETNDNPNFREREQRRWIETGTVSGDFVRRDLGDPLRAVQPGEHVEVQIEASGAQGVRHSVVPAAEDSRR